MITDYAIINQTTGLVDAVRQYDDSWYTAAVAAGNPKVQWIRPLVQDALPAITSTQKIVAGPYVVEAARVRQTWTVVAKTADEIDRDTDAAELAVLQTVVAALKAGSGTAAERLVRLERVAVWLLKQTAKRGVF